MHKSLQVVVFIIGLTGTIGILEGCRSAKKIQKVIAVQHKDSVKTVVMAVADSMKTDPRADSILFISQTLTKLESNQIDFTTFSAKVKVNYEGGEGGNEFTAFVHIRKDSLIWIKVNALLGIEAFRMVITKDSVKILDKFKKIVRLRSVSFLQQEIHLPVDFKTLQDLLIGNPIFLDTSNVLFYKKEQVGLSLMCIGALFKNYITLNPGDNTLKHSKLDDTDPMRARTCDLTYGEYEQRDKVRFSTYRRISVAEKSKLDIELNYNQYSFNEPLSFSFSIPKNYKRK
ncbi:MAG TPA: DUF4292 domain-containing protein [Puia sp.]|nr:DUF4292 domain-containing protein [Puia sp.]